jgi:hypothetical protein
MLRYATKHGLAHPAQVRAAVDAIATHYMERFPDYDPSFRWLSDDKAEVTFRAMGQTLCTTLTIRGDELIAEGKLPFVFFPFKGKILQVLEREIETSLRRARSGELGQATASL